MEKLENTEMCQKCGGYCCKKCGCDYFVEDFDSIGLKYIEQRLQEGKISIVAALNFKRLKNGQTICIPFLYLRARNINRGIVDLLSMKTICASLTENGCSYSFNARPSGGKSLIPKIEGDKRLCHPDMDQRKKLLEWEPYQNLLARLAKRITGKTVTEQLKEDVINLLYNMKIENYSEVAAEEIEDLKLNVVPLLIRAFPQEAESALNRFKKEDNCILKYRPQKQ